MKSKYIACFCGVQERDMKIAVLGAGYTGLACAWHLLHSPFRQRGIEVTVFDQKGIGGGASGIAAGLLHPYVGMHAKLNWRGGESLRASQFLIEQASISMGRPVSSPTGFLRIAMNEEQEKNFRKCAHDNSDVNWWEADRCSSMIPQLSMHKGGIFIECAQTVFSKEYLEGLWKSCRLQNADFSTLPVSKLAQFRHFDRVIIAAGSGIPEIEELLDFPITLVKGQLLELEWPDGVPPLPFPISSQSYVVMNPDGKSCVAGATYERGFASALPDMEVAKQEILSKLAFFPHLQYTRILSCRAHLRVSTKNHLPLVKQVSPRIWVLTGMGSKGLLYHALFAQELSEKVLLS